ncbi:MAG: HEAT repeat domain-containing protein [Pseudanabaenales cyanobacterium]|nr:HEAT repeat domain-containing protein [Pseudanabaenales cyanobacterium]
MEKPPFSIFSLTEDQAIALLETPPEQLDAPEDRYIAASQLVNYPGDRAINALIAAIQTPSVDLNSRIVRRKAVETLGYLKAATALPILQLCLQDDDGYTVQNAIWSLGEIGVQDDLILAEITQLLTRPGQNYRLIIQTLAKLAYQPAASYIRRFIDGDDLAISSAAISAVYQLTGDDSQLPKVVELLQHPTANARRSCIQDLIDAKHYTVIPQIARCPVSIAFRLRGIRLLAEVGMPSEAITFEQIEPALDQVIQDHPYDLDLVHEYDQTPSLEFAIKELYETDFGRCYLAAKTLLEVYPEVASAALVDEYAHRARGDYGAHYHVIKLLGWLNYAPAYEILIEALHNQAPQFQKSRTAAAISLGNLADSRAVPDLLACSNTQVWALNYACLMALNQLGEPVWQAVDLESADFLVQAKCCQLASAQGV